MRILVIAAHPDDEVLGCGGMIARRAAEGHHVAITILGEGVTSRYQQRDQADRAQVERLHGRSREVAHLLGAREVYLEGLPDNRFDTVPLLDVVKILENILAKVGPEIVYTQHGGDLNVDHQVVYRATLTATRPMAGCGVKQVLAYEVASSTEWAFQQFAPMFRPNVFINIASTLKTKIQAMEHYESEARLFPHPRSPEALEAIAKRWGSVVGVPAAEAFELVRGVE